MCQGWVQHIWCTLQFHSWHRQKEQSDCPYQQPWGLWLSRGCAQNGVPLPLLGLIWKPPGLAQRDTSFIAVLFSTSTKCTSYLNSFLKPKKPHYCLQWFIITWSLLKYFGLYTTINFAPLFHLDKKAFLAWQRARAYTEPKETLWSWGVPLVLFLQRLHISVSGIHRCFRWQNTTPLTNTSCEAHIFYTPVSTSLGSASSSSPFPMAQPEHLLLSH